MNVRSATRRRRAAWLVALSLSAVLAGCGGGSGGSTGPAAAPAVLVVNSVADLADPPPGTVTLRSALAAAPAGEAITFDPALDGTTITLSVVAEEHTLLTGEVMGMRDEPSGPVSYLVGWFPRDYGRSALVARKDVVIDASALPSGITIAWDSDLRPGARVLAVAGNLTLVNVTITGGRSTAEALAPSGSWPQPWTLARSGGIAVWGVARLERCRFHDNQVLGDFDASRDRGAYGGAIYADIVEMTDCVVSGNTATGAGAAGGGVYSVGGAGSSRTLSTIDRSAITGNRASGLYAYGGGLYTDGGGIGKRNRLQVTSSTVARNLIDPAPGLPAFLLTMGYWRGGGIYMSNGYLEVQGCTVVENEVHGVPRTDSLGRRNLAGGIAATVGNAHATEDLVLGHSIVAGNVIVEQPGGRREAHDLFTGSLFHFRSAGYNRIGVLDFSQMLVPVGEWGWGSLSRKHFPQAGDAAGIELADVVDAGGVPAAGVASAGVGAGGPAVHHYLPTGSALGVVPPASYAVPETIAEYRVLAGGTDDFLAIVLGRLEQHHGLPGFAAAFTGAFEQFLQAADADPVTPGAQPYLAPDGTPILSLGETRFYGPSQTWPRELANHPYIEFWHRLDAALVEQAIPGLGPEVLGGSAWAALFTSGYLPENPRIEVAVRTAVDLRGRRRAVDQLGVQRTSSLPGDIGAIEVPWQ
ncbi:MAG: hypothetical protein JNM50_09340 [Chromatiales bacterium]|nr:hypothetical protein [Chromatiales bacterium]